jgi:tetratricopeptide (TPR) repeat protein
MRNLPGLHELVILALAFAHVAHGQDPTNRQDAIFLRQGEAIAGKIAGFDGQTIRLQRFLPPLAGSPSDAGPVALVTVPISHIERVEFSSDEARNLKIRRATLANITEIEALWCEALLWLAIPKSPAGEIGLSYADLLLRAGDFDSARKALEIFKIIEKASWSQDAMTRAKHGRLRAMIATGAAQEAIVEAKEIVRTVEDPAILIEAKFILAQAARKALDKFVADNPRWKEDPFATPERNRLYDEALELYLYPALFFGSDIDAAARGLWGAVEVYKSAGDLEQALETSRDLVSIYPETVYAKQAQAFVETLPNP